MLIDVVCVCIQTILEVNICMNENKKLFVKYAYFKTCQTSCRIQDNFSLLWHMHACKYRRIFNLRPLEIITLFSQNIITLFFRQHYFNRKNAPALISFITMHSEKEDN